MWFIGVEVEQETSAPPPKKNPGSAPACVLAFNVSGYIKIFPRIFQVFTKCLWFDNNKPLVSTQEKNTTMILVSTYQYWS